MFTWSPYSEKGFRSIVESTARINIWEGAVRSSKTICSIVRWIEYVKTAPYGPLYMIGKTERTLKQNILDVIWEIVGPKHFQIYPSKGMAHLWGRDIRIIGASDERAEGKIRGATCAGAYGDEVTLWPESFFQQLLARMSVPGAKMFGTTNPDNPYHWLKENYLDRVNELNLRAWHFVLDDNLSLNQEYVESLKSEYVGLWYRRFILGLWVAAEGAVYDFFDPKFHVIDHLPQGVRITNWWVAMDYGHGGVTVYLLIGKGTDGKYYVLDEWRWDVNKTHRSLHASQYGEEAYKWLSVKGIYPEKIVIDPSATSLIQEVKAFYPGIVKAADNAVLEGIERTCSLLGGEKLYILSRCRGLIREIMGYSWEPKALARGEDIPIKSDDHGPDALRYFVNLIEGRRNRLSTF